MARAAVRACGLARTLGFECSKRVRDGGAACVRSPMRCVASATTVSFGSSCLPSRSACAPSERLILLRQPRPPSRTNANVSRLSPRVGERTGCRALALPRMCPDHDVPALDTGRARLAGSLSISVRKTRRSRESRKVDQSGHIYESSLGIRGLGARLLSPYGRHFIRASPRTR